MTFAVRPAQPTSTASITISPQRGLYREILEIIFSEFDRHQPRASGTRPPEERLREFIRIFCTMLYKARRQSDLTTIFASEMTQPSPFISDPVDTYNRPRVKVHQAIIRELLGEAAPDSMVRDCLVSISGQLLYHSFAWPVFSRLFPDYSPKENYEQWADHVFAFSMAGIQACRNQLQSNSHSMKNKEDPSCP